MTGLSHEHSTDTVAGKKGDSPVSPRPVVSEAPPRHTHTAHAKGRQTDAPTRPAAAERGLLRQHVALDRPGRPVKLDDFLAPSVGGAPVAPPADAASGARAHSATFGPSGCTTTLEVYAKFVWSTSHRPSTLR